jgi:hypothetical protein
LTAIASRISTFVANLEYHPKADSLIPLVQQLLVVEDPFVESQLTASLHEICKENVDLIIDFWILRGFLHLEEGRDFRALPIFWKGLEYQIQSRSTWQNIIETFIHRENWIKASFFLVESLKIFPDDPHLQALFRQTSNKLLRNTQVSPGIQHKTSDSEEFLQVEDQVKIESQSSSVGSKKRFKLSSSVQNLWEQAQECFQEFNSAHEQIFTQAFVHYAHSTLRELFNLDGSFRAGLENVIDKFQVSDYKQFLYWVNKLRNAVEHDNYFPSESEVKKIYTQVQAILSLFETSSRV